MVQPLHLTTALLEELQQMVSCNKPIETLVASITSATLPAIMEYGVLRQSTGQYPALPTALLSTKVGNALSRVRSKIGIRSDGNQLIPARSMAGQEYEFFVLEGVDPQETSDWAEFSLRFRQSCTSIGFSRDKANLLGAALHEMADNSVNHSEMLTDILVGYHVSPGTAICCIADGGIGVLASLSKCSSYNWLRKHTEAIRLALQDGVSRFGPTFGGAGFNQVFKSLVDSSGSVRFRSGQGCIEMHGLDLNANKGEEKHVLHRAGFQVSISCCVRSDIVNLAF